MLHRCYNLQIAYCVIFLLAITLLLTAVYLCCHIIITHCNKIATFDGKQHKSSCIHVCNVVYNVCNKFGILGLSLRDSLVRFLLKMELYTTSRWANFAILCFHARSVSAFMGLNVLFPIFLIASPEENEFPRGSIGFRLIIPMRKPVLEIDGASFNRRSYERTFWHQGRRRGRFDRHKLRRSLRLFESLISSFSLFE